MRPLLHRCSVAHGAGGDAVVRQESCNETFSLSVLDRRKLLAPLPMGMGFRGQTAIEIRFLLHFPCPELPRHPVTWRRAVTKGGTCRQIRSRFRDIQLVIHNSAINRRLMIIPVSHNWNEFYLHEPAKASHGNENGRRRRALRHHAGAKLPAHCSAANSGNWPPGLRWLPPPFAAGGDRSPTRRSSRPWPRRRSASVPAGSSRFLPESNRSGN